MTTDAAVLERPALDPQPTTGNGKVAHIINPQPDKTGKALTTESRIMGTELIALCGHRFTAQHDAKGLPVCGACREIWEAAKGDDLLPDPA